ncbi:hypothetical protein ACZ75_10730 [Massilia sp. NR 4-1]|nr:hypothetical protein ACZ75_10730 [Massilia sp. NR 4-1]
MRQIGMDAANMADQVVQAGRNMAAGITTGTAAVTNHAQAVSNMGETEAQAAERIRDMVAASLLQARALSDSAASADRAAAAARRANAENINYTATLARANAQMTHPPVSQAAPAASTEESQKYLASLQRQFDLLGKNAAEIAQYEVRMRGGTAATQAQAYAIVQNTEALREQIAAEKRSDQAAEAFIARLKEQAATVGMSRTQLLEHRAAQLGVSEAAAPLISRIEQTGAGVHAAGGHMEGFSLKTAGAKRELLVLAHELSQGNYKQFGGSLMVLGEQTGAASLLFSAAGLTILGLAAALGVLGYAMITGAADQKHMQDALILTNNYAGATSDSLNKLAHDAVASGGSIGAAKEAVTALASTGKFTSDQIGNIAEAVVAMEHATGRSIEETIRLFESLAVESTGSTTTTSDAVSRATLKLNDQYHFLTEAVYEQIRALEKEGSVKEASTVATNALASALKSRSEEMIENLGTVAKAWNSVKESIGGALDAVGNWGKKSTPASEVARLTKEIKQLEAGSWAFSGTMTQGQTDHMIASKKRELAKAQDELNAANDKAAAQGQEAQKQSAAAHAAARIAADDITLQKKSVGELQTKLDQYADDLAKIRAANPASALLNPDAVQAHIKAIEKAHTEQERKGPADDPRKATLDGLLRSIQDEVTAQKAKYDQLERMAALYHRAGRVSDDEFYDQHLTTLDAAQKAEAEGFDRQLAALRGFSAKTQVERQDTLNKVAQAEAAKARMEQQYADKRQALTTENELRQQAVVTSSDEAMNKYLTSLAQEVEKQEAANIGRESSRAAVERETIARLNLAIAYQQQFMAGQAAANASDIEVEQAQKILKYLEDQRDAHERLASAMAKGDAIKLDNKMWKEAEADAKTFAKSLEDSFGSVGGAIGKMSLALFDFQKNQRDIESDLAKNKGVANGDKVKILEAETTAHKGLAQAQIKQYADMSQAASGFFEKNTTGYKVMRAAEQAFRAFEMAMTLDSMANKLMATSTVTAATLVGESTKTSAVVAGSAAQISANTAVGASAAAAGVANQAMGDPYSAWVRMAAMAAAMAALGFAVNGGGGGPNVAQQRQEAAGTGTVLGNASAKSDSIAKSLDLVARNSDIELNYTAGMLTSLRSIESSISGLGNLLVRNTGITGQSSIGSSATEDGIGKLAVSSTKFFGGFGPMGNIMGKLADKVFGTVFGGKVTTLDSGITADKSTLGNVLNSGIHASQYTDTKKSGGWFRSDKYNTSTQRLGDEANDQFTKVISNMAASITQAGGLLGLSGDAFTKHLNEFEVDVGKISLKDLNGEQIQKQLETVFSKVGDDMARFSVDGLAGFQKVGEGYFETLTRIASNYANLDSIMQSTGQTFGATGMSSIAARERLIELCGGIDKMAQQSNSFAQNYMTEAERLAPVAKYVSEQMSAIGLSHVKNREQFKSTAFSIDKTTEAGAKQYAAMMALEEAFAKVYPEIEQTANAAKSASDVLSERKDLQRQLDQLTLTSAQLRAKERESIDASNLALFDRITAIQNEEAAYKRAIDAASSALSGLSKSVATEKTRINDDYTAQSNALKKRADQEKKTAQDQLKAAEQNANALRSIVDNLGRAISASVAESEELTQIRRDAAKELLTRAITASAGGADLSKFEGLDDALQTVSKPSADLYRSFEEYALEQARTANTIQQLQGNAKGQLSYAQQTVDKLTATISSIENTSQAQLEALALQRQQSLAALDVTLAKAQEELDATKGISTAVLSLKDSIAAFTSAVNAIKATPTGKANASTGAIEGLYNDLLKRPSDAGGLEFYKDSVKNGNSIGQVAGSIISSDEYKRAHDGSAKESIKDLYRALLGREADEGGLKFWTDAAQNGVGLDRIAYDIGRSPEYLKLHPFDVGTNFVPYDMPALIHEGERIFPAADNRELMAHMRQPAANNAALAVGFQAMATKLDNVVFYTRKASDGSTKAADILEKITDYGRSPILVELDH